MRKVVPSLLISGTVPCIKRNITILGTPHIDKLHGVNIKKHFYIDRFPQLSWWCVDLLKLVTHDISGISLVLVELTLVG